MRLRASAQVALFPGRSNALPEVGSWRCKMEEIYTERSGRVLNVVLNRPAKKNAMTSAMYIAFSSIINDAAKDDAIRVVLWRGAGDSFCAGNDLEDFLQHPPGPEGSAQSVLIN